MQEGRPNGGARPRLRRPLGRSVPTGRSPDRSYQTPDPKRALKSGKRLTRMLAMEPRPVPSRGMGSDRARKTPLFTCMWRPAIPHHPSHKRATGTQKRFSATTHDAVRVSESQEPRRPYFPAEPQKRAVQPISPDRWQIAVPIPSMPSRGRPFRCEPRRAGVTSLHTGTAGSTFLRPLKPCVALNWTGPYSTVSDSCVERDACPLLDAAISCFGECDATLAKGTIRIDIPRHSGRDEIVEWQKEPHGRVVSGDQVL